MRLGRLRRILQFAWVSCLAIVLGIAEAGKVQASDAGVDRPNPLLAVDLEYALYFYKAIEARGGWPSVADGPALRLGSSGPSVVALRLRLMATEDLSAPGDTVWDFDDELATAVMRFQARHGLAVDGVVGSQTRAALNVPVGERIHQLGANIARIRSMQETDGRAKIVINVAGFDLSVIESDKVTFRSAVIVGRTSRPTPRIASAVTRIIVNPSWRVPRRIAIRDILPRLKRDRSYFSAQSMRAFRRFGDSEIEVASDSLDWRILSAENFPYILVQDPGPKNALGRVKFFLPNDHDVFVHDTPARDLFRHESRAFSSGCVRVEKAVSLAKHLLRRDRRTLVDTLNDALESGETKEIDLTTPIPVEIVYLTAWADPDGRAHFRNDIYDLDERSKDGLVLENAVPGEVARAYDTLGGKTCAPLAGPDGVHR